MRRTVVALLVLLGCTHTEDESPSIIGVASPIPTTAPFPVDAAVEASTDTASLAPPPAHCTRLPTKIATVVLAHGTEVGPASMVKLRDGRWMVAHGEAATGGIAVIAQIVDPSSGAIVSSTRLDEAAHSGSFRVALRKMPSGAVVASYDVFATSTLTHGDARVFRDGAWSAPLSSVAWPYLDYDAVDEARDGTIVFHHDRDAFGGVENDALVFSLPDGSWSSVEESTLDGLGVLRPFEPVRLLDDGRVIETLSYLFEDTSNLAVRVRDVSTGWSTPTRAPATRGQVFVTDDGTVVDVTPTGSGWSATRWQEGTGWSAADVISVGLDGLPRITAGPGEFGEGSVASAVATPDGGSTIEWLGWVSDCIAASEACTFQPMRRVFRDGSWSLPEDLSFGAAVPHGHAVVVGSGQTLFVRRTSDATEIRGVARGIPTIAAHIDGAARAIVPGRLGAWLAMGGTSADDPARVAYADLLFGASPHWMTLPGVPFPVGRFGTFDVSMGEDPLGGLIVLTSATPTSTTPIVLRVLPDGSIEHVDLATPEDLASWWTEQRMSEEPSAKSAGVTLFGQAIRARVWNPLGAATIEIAAATRHVGQFQTAVADACGVLVLYEVDAPTPASAASTLELAIIGG